VVVVVRDRVARDDPARAQAVSDAQLPAVPDPPPVLAALAADAPQPDPARLAAVLDPLLAASALGRGVSTEVADVATGQVLLDRAAAEPSAPASTAKLLTAAATLTTLDPTATLTTTVVAGSGPGEVVLVGGGDPTLSTVPDSPDYPGAATVADLAAQVRAALPAGTAVTRVVVDGGLYTGPDTAPGWQPDDAPSTYAAPVTAVAVDGARVKPGATPRSGTPDLDAGAALADALGSRRATVVQGSAPPGAQVLGTVHSAPVSRLVEQALRNSDNLLAEALARQVAIARGLPASFPGSAQAVTAALTGKGLDTSGVTLADGSGLSRQDRVTARLLVDVLRGAATGSLGAAGDLLAGLPVAGYDGTLADRGDAAPADRPAAVRAKTGTLLGVNALAGTVVTADGRLLGFAVLADAASPAVVSAETALDRVTAALAACGC
jgi:D-alanyl-D-alanine carboxypeptidase/D-alanyl-D-alanine-endopeptidase (penicillin-binding protein 4)